jgi:5-methylcytosine-specific restriction endonuclease McrA
MAAKQPKERSARYNTSLKGRYRTAKRRATKTGIGFDLTLAEYAFLIESGQCYYCKRTIGRTLGSSLDRLDSYGPYDTTNAVACCRECNVIKGSVLSADEMKCVAELLRFIRGYA